MTSQPFSFHVGDGELDDLRRRIGDTRWARQWGTPGWQAGTDGDELHRLAEHWGGAFDWREHEAAINALPSFTTEIDGATVHYLRFDGADDDALPIVLTHGWPSTFMELSPLALRLSRPGDFGADPATAFTVIVPSLPGFGFSQARPAFPSDLPTHEIWHRLMRHELGFERYAAHGGDLGAGVTSRIGQSHPESVVGIHVLAVAAPAELDETTLDDEEKAYLASVNAWVAQEGAYQHQQQTRPMTLAPALSDSPVGLLAWIVEKYRAWSDSHGDLGSRFTDEFLLAQASLYWFTNTIGSSFRPYYEHAQGHSVAVTGVTVPTAVAVFPADISQPPRQWAQRSYNLQRFTEMPRGGHFAAHEEPQLLADDIREFFTDIAR